MKRLIEIAVGSLILGLMISSTAFSYDPPPKLAAFTPTGQLLMDLTTTSVSDVLPSTSASTPVATTATIQNLGSDIAYVKFWTLAVSAVASSAVGYAVQPSQTVVLTLGSARYVAAIAASSVTSLSISTGY